MTDALYLIGGLLLQTATIVFVFRQAIRSAIKDAISMEHRLTSIEVKVDHLEQKLSPGGI